MGFFLDELELMFKEVEASQSRSAKDVISSMKQIIDALQLSRYLISKGRKTFTISDFFARKNQAKLYMLMYDTYAVNLKPLFTAFTACVAMHHASKEETTSDITYYLLDEYLSLNITMEARKILHTKTRSKGAAVVSAMQKLPSEPEVSDLLTSSSLGYMVFSIRDDKTRDFIDKKVGEWEYTFFEKSNNQVHKHTKKSNIIDWSEMDKLSANHQHVTYLPESGALYVGKSDFTDLPVVHKPFIYDTNVDDFYRWQNNEYLKSKNKKNTATTATMNITQN